MKKSDAPSCGAPSRQVPLTPAGGEMCFSAEEEGGVLGTDPHMPPVGLRTSHAANLSDHCLVIPYPSDGST